MLEKEVCGSQPIIQGGAKSTNLPGSAPSTSSKMPIVAKQRSEAYKPQHETQGQMGSDRERRMSSAKDGAAEQRTMPLRSRRIA